jgi:hypothetical protein
MLSIEADRVVVDTTQQSILDALEALVDFLSGEGKTRLLGDAPFMLRALSVAEGSHSWFTPLTHHRVRRGLRALG